MVNYLSERTIESSVLAGVTFSIVRMSFGRRLELAKQLRSVCSRLEHANAGTSLDDRLEAALLAGDIDRMYIEWGLVRVDGLEIDGEPVTPSSLSDKAPEPFCREVLAAIKAECWLGEEERKNS